MKTAKNTAKNLALISSFTALLIGGQFALSVISGIEIVTVLFLTFAFTFGIKNSLILATAFSLLRCFIFGFFPSVIVLYLIYYNVFALVVGYIGYKFNNSYSKKTHLILILTTILLIVLFTSLDNLITPVFYGLLGDAWLAYCYASLSAFIPHVICATLTVIFLFPILFKICNNFNKQQ